MKFAADESGYVEAISLICLKFLKEQYFKQEVLVWINKVITIRSKEFSSFKILIWNENNRFCYNLTDSNVICNLLDTNFHKYAFQVPKGQRQLTLITKLSKKLFSLFETGILLLLKRKNNCYTDGTVEITYLKIHSKCSYESLSLSHVLFFLLKTLAATKFQMFPCTIL